MAIIEVIPPITPMLREKQRLAHTHEIILSSCQRLQRKMTITWKECKPCSSGVGKNNQIYHYLPSLGRLLNIDQQHATRYCRLGKEEIQQKVNNGNWYWFKSFRDPVDYKSYHVLENAKTLEHVCRDVKSTPTPNMSSR